MNLLKTRFVLLTDIFGRFARPQPPVLIRRALSEDTFGQYPVDKGSDIFISIWNLHHSPELWDEPEAFKPER